MLVFVIDSPFLFLLGHFFLPLAAAFAGYFVLSAGVAAPFAPFLPALAAFAV